MFPIASNADGARSKKKEKIYVDEVTRPNEIEGVLDGGWW